MLAKLLSAALSALFGQVSAWLRAARARYKEQVARVLAARAAAAKRVAAQDKAQAKLTEDWENREDVPDEDIQEALINELNKFKEVADETATTL